MAPTVRAHRPRRWWRAAAVLTSTTVIILVVGLSAIACLSLARVVLPEKTTRPDLGSAPLRTARAKATAQLDRILAGLPAPATTRLFDARSDGCFEGPDSWIWHDVFHYDCAVRRTLFLGLTPGETRSTVRDIGSRLAGTGWRPRPNGSIAQVLRMADQNMAATGVLSASLTARYEHDGDDLELNFGPASDDYPSTAIKQQEVDGLVPYWAEHDYTTEAALTAAANRAGGIILVVTVQRTWYDS